ncbi:hypothetical protein SROCM77S_05174 [Streptomyces rochei]|nr:hypothetical protein GCM10010385_24110 [Streptomyces geysiriensis]GGZ34833.1 hypothetical protein GCM10010301_02870 [Streptomyces plicatus]GHC09216.1 hypothetical protein GCM10010308_23840 [Streptomyces vinaceusdrappus]
MGRDFPDGAPSPGVEGGGRAPGGGRKGGGRPLRIVRAYFLTYSLQSATQLLPASYTTLPILDPYIQLRMGW